MKKLSRILSYLSAFLSGLTLVRLPPRKLSFVLWIPKMLLQWLTPFAAIMGSLGALMGLARRDRRTTWVGLLGAAVSVRHVVKVTAPHDSFEQALGPDWRSRIPPESQARMLPKRWTPLMNWPPQVPWQRDLIFGNSPETGKPLLADVWQPPDGVLHTGLAIIYLHGGAWYYGKKDMGTRLFFRHLAGQGHVIMDVDYTLAPHVKLFGQVTDVKRAIAWIKANAAKYGVNPARIVLMGGSAGAHLALLTAYTPNHPEFQPGDVGLDTTVRAVVSYYGPTDLQDLIAHNSDESFFSDWLGGTLAKVPEVYRLGSPLTHAGPDCPPTLLLQGAQDSGVHPERARRLHQALRDAGVTSVYVEFPDTEHAFDFPMWSPAGQAATYDTERFLALMV